MRCGVAGIIAIFLCIKHNFNTLKNELRVQMINILEAAGSCMALNVLMI